MQNIVWVKVSQENIKRDILRDIEKTNDKKETLSLWIYKSMSRYALNLFLKSDMQVNEINHL